jgi:enoyl-CoA hydratase/carnithine racemase
MSRLLSHSRNFFLGVPLIDGGTARLSKLIGFSRAMDLILTGRSVNATEALNIGLVNRVVSKGNAYKEAFELANQIAAFPQECLTADRQSAYYATFKASSFDDALKFEKENSQDCLMEVVRGAGKFAGGAGRSGTFDLHDN